MESATIVIRRAAAYQSRSSSSAFASSVRYAPMTADDLRDSKRLRVRVRERGRFDQFERVL